MSEAAAPGARAETVVGVTPAPEAAGVGKGTDWPTAVEESSGRLATIPESVDRRSAVAALVDVAAEAVVALQKQIRQD